MPTVEECNDRRIENVRLSGRVDAISQRLDEVLDELKEIRDLLKKYAWVMFLIAVFGQQAIPIITKILGAG